MLEECALDLAFRDLFDQLGLVVVAFEKVFGRLVENVRERPVSARDQRTHERADLGGQILWAIVIHGGTDCRGNESSMWIGHGPEDQSPKICFVPRLRKSCFRMPSSLPPGAGVVRETKSNTLPSCIP